MSSPQRVTLSQVHWSSAHVHAREAARELGQRMDLEAGWCDTIADKVVRKLRDLFGEWSKQQVIDPPAAHVEESRLASRAGRLANRGVDSALCNNGKPHGWQPLSFVFETQMLDDHGRVVMRQPAIQDARVYAVCMGCYTYTYLVAEWTGYYLGGAGDGFAGPEPGAVTHDGGADAVG